MSESKGRAGRLRTVAVVVLIAGVLLAVLAGMAFPAQVTTAPVILTKITTYTASTEADDGAFNWLFAVLVMGPCLVAAAVLYGCAEIVAGLRRSARSRSSEGGGREGGSGEGVISA